MLRKLLVGIGVVVAVAVLALLAAVATGYLVVGDPAAAADQVITGDFDEPGVSVEETRIGPVGVPEAGIEDVGTDAATVRNEFRINNTNHLGGRVRAVEYDVYLSGNRDGEYDHVGNGSMHDLRVPPNGTVTETNTFDLAYEDLVSATGGAGIEGLVGGATWYAHIEGEAAIALGPASFTVEFETVNEVGR